MKYPWQIISITKGFQYIILRNKAAKKKIEQEWWQTLISAKEPNVRRKTSPINLNGRNNIPCDHIQHNS